MDQAETIALRTSRAYRSRLPYRDLSEYPQVCPTTRIEPMYASLGSVLGDGWTSTLQQSDYQTGTTHAQGRSRTPTDGTDGGSPAD